MDSDAKGMMPDLQTKHVTFCLNREPSKRGGNLKPASTAARPDTIADVPTKGDRPTHQNSQGKCARADDSPDELALLRESQRIARIGSWWRCLPGPAWWSEQMYRLYGVSPDTFVPTRESMLERIHPDDRAKVRKWLKSFEDGHEPNELEYRIILPDDSIRWMSSRVYQRVVGTNSTLSIVGTAQDVTERKIIEEQIKVHVAKLETAFMQTVEVITALSAMRDPYTAGHERRVAEIAVTIGAAMGFDSHRQQGLRVAGYLHDVGKINTPGKILSKPGELTPMEFALIKEHPRAGYDALKNVDFPWPVAQVALQHHERMDGSGYPQGLKGDEIILEARIVAVADVIESMSSHRPYRPALGLENALAEIERGRGAAFDERVTDACLRVFRETCI